MSAPRRIAIVSHRGGSMKSTLAAMLGLAFAAEGTDTLVADLSAGGGSAQLHHELLADETTAFDERGVRVPLRRHRTLPLSVVHAGWFIAASEARRMRSLENWANRHEVAILDSPATSQEVLRDFLAPMDLVLVTLPSDAVAVRGAVRFLEILREVRAMPGRRFSVAVIPTGTGKRSHENIAIDRFTNEALAPLLLGASLPWDEGLAAQVSDARLPELETLSPLVRSNIELLRAGIRVRLSLPAPQASRL
jgi:cellulose biosynthesis protein BcsQ